MPDTRHSAEALLSDVEDRLDAVDTGILAAEPVQLQAASTELRSVSRAFAEALAAALSAEAFDAEFRRRIETVAQRMANQREQIARRNVVVMRALESIMPKPAGVTYSRPGVRAYAA